MTVRIKLIVTGDLERRSLHRSLRARFPETRGGQSVEWLPPRKLVGGTTSDRLVLDDAPSRDMRDMVKAIVNEARFGSAGTQPDLVVALADLELGNLGQPHVVTKHLAKALDQYLEQLGLFPNDEHALRERLRETCSFHLLAPMTEGYFFGEPAALVRAGVQDPSSAKLGDPDVEAFYTVDTDPKWKARCEAKDAEQAALGHEWWSTARHPKRYLEHLTDTAGGTIYDEILHGVPALEVLEWPVVAREPAWTPFVRALFQDIANWFSVACPVGIGTRPVPTYPGKSVRPEDRRLRNI